MGAMQFRQSQGCSCQQRILLFSSYLRCLYSINGIASLWLYAGIFDITQNQCLFRRFRHADAY